MTCKVAGLCFLGVGRQRGGSGGRGGATLDKCMTLVFASPSLSDRNVSVIVTLSV